LTALQDGQVSFTWKDYRQEAKTKVMTLPADEFMRRFLLHTVPDGFHRIRHVGFLANGHRTAKLALCRALHSGAPLLGLPVPNAGVVAARGTFDGRETLHDVEYFARIAPLTDYNGNVVGAYWFGVPYANFEALATHTLEVVAFWGLIGIAIAIAFGVLVADRLGASIARRSQQVNDSAKELRILVVGGEVSGDHVEQTREKLVKIEELAERVADANGSPDAGALRDLASEAVGDVVVINTLTGELSMRLRDAATRVEQLGEVAEALDALVVGSRPSRN